MVELNERARGRFFRYVHQGDFRISPQLAVKRTRIDIISLDTAYFNPRVSRRLRVRDLLIDDDTNSTHSLRRRM